MIQITLYFALALTLSSSLEGRNPRRPFIDQWIPKITVSYADETRCKPTASTSKKTAAPEATVQADPEAAILKSAFLRLRPIKQGFDQKFFDEHCLPRGTLDFRHNTGKVDTAILSRIANKLVDEINQKKRDFTDFIILKDKDFNYTTLAGLLIVKFKNYPFVLKLSIEHPDTMTAPFSKSFETNCIFVIGGNLRHFSNFTRVANLEQIKQKLSYNPFYLKYLHFPRKWYWKPDEKRCKDLKIVWDCDGTQEVMYTPSIYATISDFIEIEPVQPQRDLNKFAMKVATDTGFLIDPHAGNIVLEAKTGQYVMVDTENFQIMVGLDKGMKAKSYINWFIELCYSCFKTFCFRDKQERLAQSMLV